MTDALPSASPPASALAVRARIVETLRRDLIGPGPQDADLAREVLKENPSRWYLTGFLAPSLDGNASLAEEPAEVGDPIFGDDAGADPEAAAPALPMTHQPTSRRRALAACRPRSA